jgi:hypothetical protein
MLMFGFFTCFASLAHVPVTQSITGTCKFQLI